MGSGGRRDQSAQDVSSTEGASESTATTGAPTIRYALDDEAIATITFDRQEKRNAFDNAMAASALNCFDRAEREHARVVVLRATPGVQVWCAGHDLSELHPGALDSENPMLRLFDRIQSTPIPVIAMVEGSVYAGGLILLLCADIVIAAPNADVAITSNRLGIPLAPEIYALWLRVMGIHKAKELLFTAATIQPREAYVAGLYNRVVDQDQLENETYRVAQSILSCAPEAVANSKFQLNLLAAQLAWTDQQRAQVEARNSDLLRSPQLQERVAALLASLGK